MARYPAVPKVYDYLKDNPEADRVHREISQWGAALVNQLDTRDAQVDNTPSTKIIGNDQLTYKSNPITSFATLGGFIYLKFEL